MATNRTPDRTPEEMQAILARKNQFPIKPPISGEEKETQKDTIEQEARRSQDEKRPLLDKEPKKQGFFSKLFSKAAETINNIVKAVSNKFKPANSPLIESALRDEREYYDEREKNRPETEPQIEEETKKIFPQVIAFPQLVAGRKEALGLPKEGPSKLLVVNATSNVFKGRMEDRNTDYVNRMKTDKQFDKLTAEMKDAAKNFGRRDAAKTLAPLATVTKPTAQRLDTGQSIDPSSPQSRGGNSI